MKQQLPSASLRYFALLLAMLLPYTGMAQEESSMPTLEDDLSEVDRILQDLATEVPPESPEMADPFVEQAPAAVEAVSETEAPVEVPVAEVPPADQVPMIRLEQSTAVEGADVAAQDDSNLISITLDRVQLADVVRIFARSSGANIIIPDGLDETVSANLQDVEWRQALEVILADKNYVLIQRRPGIYAIARQDQLAAEPLTAETLELQYITVDNALPTVQSMIITSNARVTGLPSANMLIVTETATNLQEIKRVLTLIDRPRDQVFIEAKFVELNDRASKELGINWQVLQGGYQIGVSDLVRDYSRTNRGNRLDGDGNIQNQFRQSENQATRTSENDFINPIAQVLKTEGISSRTTRTASGAIVGRNILGIDEAGIVDPLVTMEREIISSAILSAQDFALTLHALQTLNGVRIVSNPKLLVANGQTATFHSGENEPNVRALPQGDFGTSFAFELAGFIEIGVKLEVTPIISTAKNITLRIAPELSEVTGRVPVGEAGTSFPITSVRRVNTEFALDSGKTVAIGGLTRGREEERITKVPLLGDIPIIGKFLFRNTVTDKRQDEVIIFVSVDMAHVEELNDSFGIPEQSELIQLWLKNEEARRAAAAEAAATPAVRQRTKPAGR